MEPRAGERRIHPAWWTLILIVTLIGMVALTAGLYTGSFTRYVPVTLTSDRAGLIMESGGKVMMNGVQVGQVAAIRGSGDPVSIKLDISPDQIDYIPANVGAQIRATTIFGAKYVDLIYPDHPSAKRLSAGAVLQSRNVTTEVNTVFQNLVGLLDQIDPAKLNAVLTALSEGFRGQGERIGQSITDANQVLLAVNPRSTTMQRNWREFKDFADVYDSAAQNILSVLDSASTTSTTITGHAAALDALLLNTIGFAQAGVDFMAPNQKNFIDAINTLEPTTALLLNYNPTYTCMLVGANWWLDNGGRAAVGGNGRTYVADAAILMGDDPYVFPDNLPIVGAKGGPGGKPSCGSLPDATKAFPVRQLVTNTGWGTGLDIRPNPGIAHPCYANYLPVTRAVPEPPSIRQCLPGPAPGPIPYPGAPPYGASLYGPGGVPLWPGLPSAPPRADTTPPTP
ncbi:MCE family protein [Mycolicibacterium sp. CH28]|uniref:MCE family protein n=1 Tax=Mycolicibacterium sp. CH28 TaxID=2512237 RepID=UPI001081658D|nr:MCE family protein [Mycolicibacterium sp. CH28]TGD87896.1 MCE family protein [Mycolicibacterium sp. CH28]